jgi:hypothetical protein
MAEVLIRQVGASGGGWGLCSIPLPHPQWHNQVLSP